MDKLNPWIKAIELLKDMQSKQKAILAEEIFRVLKQRQNLHALASFIKHCPNRSLEALPLYFVAF